MGLTWNDFGASTAKLTACCLMKLRLLPLLTILVAMILFGPVSVQGQVPRPQQTVRPNNLNAQYYRAETAWKSGNSVLEAKARVDEVLTALPTDQEALKLRSRILLSMDRYDEAYLDARSAVKIKSDDAEAYAILCEAARRSGRTTDAIAAMEQATDLVIDNAALHVHLSREAVLLGQFDRAEAFARTAIIQAPDDPSTHYQMARVFAEQGKYDEARTVVENGVKSRVLSRGVVMSDSLLAPVLSGAIDH